MKAENPVSQPKSKYRLRTIITLVFMAEYLKEW
jgi:hypothetical protein